MECCLYFPHPRGGRCLPGQNKKVQSLSLEREIHYPDCVLLYLRMQRTLSTTRHINLYILRRACPAPQEGAAGKK
jgi:hypothetical protein